MHFLFAPLFASLEEGLGYVEEFELCSGDSHKGSETGRVGESDPFLQHSHLVSLLILRLEDSTLDVREDQG